jgi:hypothetical protein
MIKGKRVTITPKENRKILDIPLSIPFELIPSSTNRKKEKRKKRGNIVDLREKAIPPSIPAQRRKKGGLSFAVTGLRR